MFRGTNHLVRPQEYKSAKTSLLSSQRSGRGNVSYPAPSQCGPHALIIAPSCQLFSTCITLSGNKWRTVRSQGTRNTPLSNRDHLPGFSRKDPSLPDSRKANYEELADVRLINKFPRLFGPTLHVMTALVNCCSRTAMAPLSLTSNIYNTTRVKVDVWGQKWCQLADDYPIMNGKLWYVFLLERRVNNATKPRWSLGEGSRTTRFSQVAHMTTQAGLGEQRR